MKEFVFLLKVAFAAILRAFFPAMFKEIKNTMQDSSQDIKLQPELKQRLQRRIKSRWTKALVLLAIFPATVLFNGCGTKTVYVPPGEPVRLRGNIKNAKVWVMGQDGRPMPSQMNLQNGWYIVSDSNEYLSELQYGVYDQPTENESCSLIDPKSK